MIDATAAFYFGLGFLVATLIKLTWWMARVEYWSRRAKRAESALARRVGEAYVADTTRMLDDVITRARQRGQRCSPWLEELLKKNRP